MKAIEVHAVVFLLCSLFLAGVRTGSGATNSQDVAALTSLMNKWQNVPSSWKSSTDPCSTPWYGVTCNGGRVTELRLGSVGLKGTLSDDIGQLTGLDYLDLSNNPDLGGLLPSSIGMLSNLATLILQGCSFIGNIPTTIGNLTQLYFLAMNTNQFNGSIPASLGACSNLFWVDLSDNQLTGTIPVSSTTQSGLDKLVKAQHFHFNKNQLQGPISPNLFVPGMQLLHLLLDQNQITGQIPTTISAVTKLQILQLNDNQFNGAIPTSISKLTSLQRLTLSNNKFNGPIPDLTALSNLNYIDMSNIQFNPSTAPSWFSTLTSLTTLMMDNASLNGTTPSALFTFAQIQIVSLAFDGFTNNLNMSGKLGPELMTVNFTNNNIGSVDLSSSYNETLVLIGNPVCLDPTYSKGPLCTVPKSSNSMPYSTSLSHCGSVLCPNNQELSPASCTCSYPYQGSLVCPAPMSIDLTNPTTFEALESRLLNATDPPVGSIYLNGIGLDVNNYLMVGVAFFPLSGLIFGQQDIITISTTMNNQTALKAAVPSIFGPCHFTGIPYAYGSSGQTSFTLGVAAIVGIAIGGVVLISALAVVICLYVKQRKRTEEIQAEIQNNPFASWPGYGGKAFKDGPTLKGARFFTFAELQKCTNGFSDNNEIGAGGYGRVYKGVLQDGVVAAIKRAQPGSMQGVNEFKNEIELLSRVHMKNLVSLLGFCYENGEQMLVYEYIPNGTLRENLIGKGGKRLDWSMRLKIALGSARGLAYLHELADPPIIHRDVKSANILLDEQYNAKVADFGLSKLVTDKEKSYVSTQVKGTLGYLDPEYYMTQQLSEKSDVYSFGVVMLELITARQPIERGQYIVRVIRDAIDTYDQQYYGLKDIVDPLIQDNAKSFGFRKFVQVALDCVEDQATNRPTMNEVVKEIEVIIQNEGLPMSATPESSYTGFSGARGSEAKYAYDEQQLLGDGADTSASTLGYRYSDVKAK